MPTNNSDSVSERVIVIHGFLAHGVWMWPLVVRLRRSGFRAESWSYRSLFSPIRDHAERLSDLLARETCEEPVVHIVAHSMGCIVTRTALQLRRPGNLGRVVFMAPPNRGSPVARWISGWAGRVLVPTEELSDREGSFVRRLPESDDSEMGIIVAKYDLLIPDSHVRLTDRVPTVVIPATHSSLLISSQAARQTVHFLRFGSFEPSAPKSS